MPRQRSNYNSISRTAQEPKETFRVKAKDLPVNIRIGPGFSYATTGDYVEQDPVTIIEVVQRKGSESGWGLIEKYELRRDGWVALDFTQRVE